MIEIKVNQGEIKVNMEGYRKDVVAETVLTFEHILKTLGPISTMFIMSKVTEDFARNTGVFGQEVPHE